MATPFVAIQKARTVVRANQVTEETVTVAMVSTKNLLASLEELLKYNRI